MLWALLHYARKAQISPTATAQCPVYAFLLSEAGHLPLADGFLILGSLYQEQFYLERYLRNFFFSGS